MIRQGIKLYKKANGINLAKRGDYPLILKNIFGVSVTTETLDRMSANELMDILIKEGT